MAGRLCSTTDQKTDQAKLLKDLQKLKVLQK